MMKLKKAGARVFYYSGLSRSAKKPIILAYHRIMQRDDNIFDDSVISASPDSFDSQMKYLKENCDVVSLEKINSRTKSQAVAITFDDGYIDNYTIAYPILKKHNIPATIFLATDYIGTDKLFWWDILGYIARKQGKVSTKLGYFDLKNKNDYASLLRKIKDLPETQKIIAINSIIEATKVKLSKTKLTIGWNQAKEMSKNNITFGSHTKTHAILTKIAVENAREELEDSKKIIESKIGKKIQFLSFPNGHGKDFSETIEKMAKVAGYTNCFSYIPGFAEESYVQHRVFVRYEEELVDFKAKLAGFDNVFSHYVRWSR